MKIYLDDIRTPIDPEWIVVRSYEEFIKKVEEIGLKNIEVVSLDHDLGDTAMKEYFKNVAPNYQLNYDNIKEKTGYDAAKWLVAYSIDFHEKLIEANDVLIYFTFPQVYTHSANPIGSANIMGYINNYLMNHHKPQSCVRVKIPHTVEK